MGFFAPHPLLGLLAAGIPIPLDPFFLRPYRTLPWAAMKFLLRVLILVVLALALARPIFPSFAAMALFGLFVFVQAFVLVRLVGAEKPLFGSRFVEAVLWEGGGLVLLLAVWLMSPSEHALG